MNGDNEDHQHRMEAARADERTLHFALRVPLATRIDSDFINTVDAHNEVARRLGQVWIAKFGKPGTEARANRLRSQIERGNKTLLVLVAKEGGHFVAHEASLVSIHYGQANSQILQMAPAYYSKLDQSPALWFAVRETLRPTDLSRFRLASNKRPLAGVLAECRTASMLIELGAPAIASPL